MQQFNPPYEYAGGYIMQKLPEYSLPRKVTVGRFEYYSRRQLHCSLIAVKNLIGLVQEHDGSTEDAAEAKILQAVGQIFAANPPKVTAVTSEIRIASKLDDYKQSIVVMVTVAGLKEAFAELSQILGFTLHLQPAHITLYTLENGLPIGLTTNEQLAKLSQIMTSPEREQFNQVVDLSAVFGELYEDENK